MNESDLLQTLVDHVDELRACVFYLGSAVVLLLGALFGSR